ncbi:hypothetical protein EAO75_36780 [Streptomyces sp. uw30]|nr:hypothetical protein EAO75_36780 [Streptomyces sp. uw30]
MPRCGEVDDPRLCRGGRRIGGHPGVGQRVVLSSRSTTLSTSIPSEELRDEQARSDRRPTPAQLRFLLARMGEALSDVCRVAESRGGRLRVLAREEPGQG